MTSTLTLPEELTFVRVFDAFYEEVHSLRVRVQGRQRGGDPTLSPETVRSRVQRFLEDKSSEFGRHSESFEYQQFRQVLYIMAALADEIFLSFEWSGREEWGENLVEKAMFASHDAGVRFFDLLDDLLEARDSSQRSVAVIYLLALSLGFRGRLYGTDRMEETLTGYRQRLYKFIYGAAPTRRLETPLTPQAHWYNVSGAPERFPSVGRWFILGTLAIIVVLLGSHGAWVYGTSDIDAVLADFGTNQ